MQQEPIVKLERKLRRIFLILALVAIVGVILSIRSSKAAPPADDPELAEETGYVWEDGLSDSTLWLPDGCNLYDRIPDIFFWDKQGMRRSIREFAGKPAVLVFWASWCEDCGEQLPLMNNFREIAAEYSDLNFIFVNRTDGQRETMETADAYLESQGLLESFGEECFFYDQEEIAYQMLQMHNIPTTLFVDQAGVIKAWQPRQITKETVFQALLENLLTGSGVKTAEFITGQMMDKDGGFHSLYSSDRTKMERSDVLSESQGAMLEYAVVMKNQELFDLVLNYIENNMRQYGLTSWKVSVEEVSPINALIDDLRIYSSLRNARMLWGGYDDSIRSYQQALREYAINNNRYVDFYDGKREAYAERFTLSYGDLQTMRELAETNMSFAAAYEEALDIVVNGQISPSFPLYYSWYNYKMEKYETDDLNSAEAMVTLLHLAEVDMLPESSVHWLKGKMRGDGIKARYDMNGEVVDQYDYDSTAVYALVVMIADELGDAELRGLALKKMERHHITDLSYPYSGGFGEENGEGFTSFDQIMPALAYAYSEASLAGIN